MTTTLAPRLDALAIVLGRAGSKGVPGKNLARIAGKPCARWTLDAARAARRVAHTVFSTDSPALAQLAARAGALPIERPKRLATDRATIDDAARHAVHFLETLIADRFHDRQPFVILYANVPIRPPGLIDRAVELLWKSRADSVQSYAPVGKFHPWWTARLDAHARVAPWEGRVLNHGIYRRQDLPPAFIPDGGVLVVTRRALMLEIKGVARGPHAFFGKDRRGIVNPEGSVIDIDAPTDLLVADAVLRSAAR
ncbi:MAG: hypothetical protein AB7K52_00920 [Phycisphaerales bacterium]